MRKHIAVVLFIAFSASAFAQSSADPLGAEVNADAETRARWEDFYNTLGTTCDCINGVSVFRTLTYREYLAEGKAIGASVDAVQTQASAPPTLQIGGMKITSAQLPQQLAMQAATECRPK